MGDKIMHIKLWLKIVVGKLNIEDSMDNIKVELFISRTLSKMFGTNKK
jgi:hypothetical protein